MFRHSLVFFWSHCWNLGLAGLSSHNSFFTLRSFWIRLCKLWYRNNGPGSIYDINIIGRTR